MRHTIQATFLCLTVLAARAAAQTGDECAGAQPISGAGAFPFDTTQATTSQPAWPCGIGGSDIWFRWTAPGGGDYDFDTCVGASYDSTLEVLEGACGALVSLACNDDFCGLSSALTLQNAIGGQAYYVRVGGFASAVGTGVLTVTATTQPGVTLLFDQEHLVSSAGTGHAGADVSERHHCVMAYQDNTFVQDDALIEDFIVPDDPNGDGWRVTRIRAYAFDCNEDPPPVPPAEPHSTITRMCVRVWSGVPHAPGSHVLFGDARTNVLSDTGWTGIYRVPDAGTHQLTSFPIMYADAAVDWYLPDGATYYIEWGLDAEAATCINQPACPPNPGRTGNALWVLHGTPPRPCDRRQLGCAILPSTGGQDELPFQIYGEPFNVLGVLDAGCAPLLNSAGASASITLVGTGLAGDTIAATVAGGVPGQFGYFLSGPNSGLYIVPPGSSGVLCIAAPQFRYNGGPGVAQHLFVFGPAGHSRPIAGAGGPGPVILETDGSFGPVPPVLAGTTRAFQAWYRDVGSFGSNFSDARQVIFN